MASGSLTTDLLQKSVHTLRSESAWIGSPRTEATASSIFAMALRVPALAHFSVHVPFTAFPYRLVELLRRGDGQDDEFEWQTRIAGFFATPSCCLDRFSEHIRQMFASEQELRSDRAQEMLNLICEHIDCSTYSTERLHSSNSRRARSRTSTHEMSLPQVAAYQAEGIPLSCRLFKCLQAETPEHSRSSKRKSGEEGTDPPPAKKKRGGGGGWRAFLHCEGQGEGHKDLHDLCLRYNSLSDEERNKFRELGRDATQLHRQGRAFPRTFLQASTERVAQLLEGKSLQMVLGGSLVSSAHSLASAE